MIDAGPDVLAFEIDGLMTGRDMETVAPAMQKALESGGPVDMLVRVRNYGGFSPDLLTRGDVWPLKLAALGHVRRYALVGAPGWMASTIRVIGAMLPMEIRLFDAGDEDSARAWLKEKVAA